VFVGARGYKKGKGEREEGIKYSEVLTFDF
jgi:hypothetical protein